MSTRQYYYYHDKAELIVIVVAVSREDADELVARQYPDNVPLFICDDLESKKIQDLYETNWFAGQDVYRTEAASQIVREDQTWIDEIMEGWS